MLGDFGAAPLVFDDQPDAAAIASGSLSSTDRDSDAGFPTCADRGSLRIENDDERTVLIWNAEGAAEGTLAALKCRIGAAGEEETFRLRFNYNGWAEEEVRGRSAALERIEQIMAHIADPPPEDVRIDRHPPSGSETRRIRDLAGLWHAGNGVLDTERKALFDTISPHLLIFDDLKYRHIGQQSLFVRTGGRKLADHCIGLPYDYDPAQESYSRSVCQEYETVLRQNAPEYDHVCARIQVGDQSNWLIYQRLIAPFRLPSGRPILVVLCDPTSRVNIPFLGGGGSECPVPGETRM